MNITNRVERPRTSLKQPWVLRSAVLAACAVFLATGLAPSSVDGCGWSGFEHSVRFSNGFGIEDRLPPLPRYESEEERTYDDDTFWGYYGDGDDIGCGCGEEMTEHAYRQLEALNGHVSNASAEIAMGHVAQARASLEAALRESAGASRDVRVGEYGRAQVQSIRNQVIDLLDVVREGERGVSAEAIHSYFVVRKLGFEKADSSEVWTNLSVWAGREPRLRDNVAYLNGAYLYRRKQFEKAGTAFDDFLEQWPASEKVEAATYMSGLSWLRVVEQARASKTWSDQCRNLDIAKARFTAVASNSPASHYAVDARGWLARVAVFKYEYPSALTEYYAMLANRQNPVAQLEGARSLHLVRHNAQNDDMLEVERRIERMPEVALAYAYFEIYNEEASVDADEVVLTPTQSTARRRQLERVVDFCSRMLQKWPGGAVGSGFALRVAGACLELDRHSDAVRFAERAIASNATNKETEQALYLMATGELRMQQFARARTAVDRILGMKPDRETEERARRLLAMICEEDHDLAGALDQYRTLGYEADVAYLVDVLMSVGQLESYVASRPRDPEIDWLRYAVGVRLLRAGLYERAEQALELTRTTTSNVDDVAFENSYLGERSLNVKNSLGYDSRVRTPRPDWVSRDLQTARDLGALERLANQPSDREHSAEARYQFAAYLFEHESLLFYNPSLWWGNRAELLGSLEYGDALRLPGEEANLWSETNAHDALAQSVDAFLDVVDRYPETNAAADALYSAAVAHERLANFNGYWRTQYEKGRHAGRRLVTYDDVRRLYPKYRIPLATVGWEPSTRTVDGGPAYAPSPPKPKPIPLWRHYAKRVPEVIAEFGGPVVTKVWGTIRTAASWLVDLVKRASIVALQAMLLTAILVAWIAAVRSSFRLALDAVNGHKRARALLPASSAFRPREYAWLSWAAQRAGSLRDGFTSLSITELGTKSGRASGEPRLDDRVVLFIERARLFLSTTPQGLACVLVVVTHVPILVLMAMAM